MKADIGFILIGLGLVGVYIALGGKFGKSSTSPDALATGVGTAGKGVSGAQNFPSMGKIAPGGAHAPVNAPDIPAPGSQAHQTPKDPTTGGPVGSGGESIQSRLTQLGHVLVLHPTDRRASYGGFR